MSPQNFFFFTSLFFHAVGALFTMARICKVVGNQSLERGMQNGMFYLGAPPNINLSLRLFLLQQLKQICN